MFQRIVVGRALPAAVATAIVLVGGIATAATEPVETGDVDGATVAVAAPPVPPTTAEVAVGLPPVPPTTAEVAVGLPPVPPTTAEVASAPPAPPTTRAPRAVAPATTTTTTTTTVPLDPELVAEQVTSLVVIAATQAALALRR